MANLLHRTPGWVLFLIIFILPFFGYLFSVFTMFDEMSFLQTGPQSEFNPEGPNQEEILNVMMNLMKRILSVMVVLGGISYLTLFSWYWSIGYGLKDYLPEYSRIKPGTFLILKFVFVILSASIGYLYWDMFINDFMLNIESFRDNPPGQDFTQNMMLRMMAVMSIGVLLFVVNIFLILQMAKTLKAVETQKHPKGYAGEFFLILFSFVGVWVIQPKLNRLAKTGSMTFDETDPNILDDI